MAKRCTHSIEFKSLNPKSIGNCRKITGSRLTVASVAFWSRPKRARAFQRIPDRLKPADLPLKFHPAAI
jgi:hypothetical protein